MFRKFEIVDITFLNRLSIFITDEKPVNKKEKILVYNQVSIEVVTRPAILPFFTNPAI
jgi:hypothetical protein